MQTRSALENFNAKIAEDISQEYYFRFLLQEPI